MANRVLWQPMRELAAASITTTYQPLKDPAYSSTDATHYGLPTVARQFFIQNLTDQPLYISWTAPVGSTDTAFSGPSTNGTTYRNIILPLNGFFVSDISTNKLGSLIDDGVAVAKGAIVTVRYSGSAPTTGSVYFSFWCSSKDVL